MCYFWWRHSYFCLAARKAEEEQKKKDAMQALSASFGGYKSQGKFFRNLTIMVVFSESIAGL